MNPYFIIQTLRNEHDSLFYLVLTANKTYFLKSNNFLLIKSLIMQFQEQQFI